jgi:7-alpha-hydroxysteroid dehydrogenase
MVLLDRFRVDGRAAIITGAGSGIGAASALALAEAGADVVLAARTSGQLRATADAVQAAGRRARVVVANLADLGEAPRLVAEARDAFGRLDIIVNNVGGAVPRPFLETSPDDIEQAVHFNVSTAHALLRSAASLMLDSGGGAVINMSSVAGTAAGRGLLSYGTANGALIHYTRLAAQDLAPRIRVNAIAAGTIETDATRAIAGDAALRAGIEAVTPLRRLGTAQDVAAAVVYLASPAGAYLTGTVLEVDGGLQTPATGSRYRINAPPSGTASRCDPLHTAAGPGPAPAPPLPAPALPEPAAPANTLPMPSSRSASPARPHRAWHHPRPTTPAAEKDTRVTPPPARRPTEPSDTSAAPAPGSC